MLFGSRATGSPPPRPDSDLDIAVLGCSEEHFWACYRQLSEVFSELTLDLVPLNTADPLLRHEIMGSGVRLYGDPDLFCDYRSYAYRDFVDSEDLRALEERLSQVKTARLGELLGGSP